MVGLLFYTLEDMQDKTRKAKGLAREVKTYDEHRRHATSSVGRAILLHSEQLYGKITFVSYPFRATAGRDASSAQPYRYVFVCGIRLVSVRRASVPQGA